MKKTCFIIIFMLIILATTGCVKDKETSKTCTTISDNITYIYKYNATNDIIDKFEMNLLFDNSLFGVDSLDVLTDNQKEQIKLNILNTLGLQNTNYDGISINIDINDKINVSIVADLKIADKDFLKKLGFNFSNTDMSLKNTVKIIEENGAVCN